MNFWVMNFNYGNYNDTNSKQTLIVGDGKSMKTDKYSKYNDPTNATAGFEYEILSYLLKLALPAITLCTTKNKHVYSRCC